MIGLGGEEGSFVLEKKFSTKLDTTKLSPLE
ncbi:hypothetical protein Pla144_03610 [Bythopirellula polymerisocia]|uniref:Uncharacterized protein n=1 Tax=Bythopirellula polymerisocia TaxID=2528003 RepID=A0A5C6CX81_9BACT|nr:hypothetical protein Pla144_03610 [Bythopirellula polymerisocia]